MPSLRLSALRDFFDILKQYDLYNVENHNKTENTYLINNTLIEFFSIDDAQKRRGSKRDILFVDEANELSSEDFFQLNIRTTQTVYLGFNPSEQFWYNDQLQNRDDITIIHSTYKDNPYLNEEQVNEIERLQFTDKQYYQIYALGEFAGHVDLIYTYIPVDDIPTFGAKLVALGLDWGYSNDPTALLEVWIWNDALYFNELLYERSLTNQDIINKLNELGANNVIMNTLTAPKNIRTLSGTVNVNSTIFVVGTGTKFTKAANLDFIGANTWIAVNSEIRMVNSIISDTLLTVNSAFTITANNEELVVLNVDYDAIATEVTLDEIIAENDLILSVET
jgi:phage terminase large subunit